MIDLDVLLPAIAAGDSRAFARWVAGCEPRLRASLLRYAAVADVEAVLQETLLRVWQVAPRIAPDGRPECLLRFAIRVGRNVAVSEARRLRHTIDPEHLEELGAEAAPGDPLLRELIVGCRDKLPAQPAAVLALRLETAGSEPDAHLAARLDMRVNTFLQNLARARKLLLSCLERAGVRLEEVL
jgi:RNA polymerase sigma-70 factor (ECF subfamily)